MGNGVNTSIGGLHDILFQQLEVLANGDLTGEALELEMKRTDSMCKLTGQIIDNGRLALNVARISQELGTAAPEVKYLVDSQPGKKG